MVESLDMSLSLMIEGANIGYPTARVKAIEYFLSKVGRMKGRERRTGGWVRVRTCLCPL